MSWSLPANSQCRKSRARTLASSITDSWAHAVRFASSRCMIDPMGSEEGPELSIESHDVSMVRTARRFGLALALALALIFLFAISSQAGIAASLFVVLMYATRRPRLRPALVRVTPGASGALSIERGGKRQ